MGLTQSSTAAQTSELVQRADDVAMDLGMALCLAPIQCIMSVFKANCNLLLTAVTESQVERKDWKANNSKQSEKLQR